MDSVRFERLVKVSSEHDFSVVTTLSDCVLVDRTFTEDMTLRECRECTSQFVVELKHQGFHVDVDFDSKLERPVLQVSL